MIRVTNENWIIWESSLWCRRRDFSRLVDCGVRAGMRDRYSRLLVSRDWDRPSPRSGWPPGRRAAPVAKLTLSSDLAYTKPMYSRVMYYYCIKTIQYIHTSNSTLQNYTPVSLCCFQEIYSLYEIHLGICFACQGRFELRKIIDYLRGYSPFG